jgi:hypothetical protein
MTALAPKPGFDCQRQPQDKYIVRMPDGLRDRIAQKAKARGRSMNAEIVRTLETAFPAEREDGAKAGKPAKRITMTFDCNGEQLRAAAAALFEATPFGECIAIGAEPELAEENAP